ncbi:MAG: glycoside hydrolase 5 family protein, partial [Flavisolibacter sp.]
MKIVQIIAILSLLFLHDAVCAQTFVQRRQQQFFLEGKPYYYIGANYWYGGTLGIDSRKQGGGSSVDRLRKELDFLKSKGINNLRVMAGAEGSGLVHGVERVGPPLQTEKGKFDTDVLKGLDILLDEMSKRNMKAVLFLSNNWEWSGGLLQYLRWNDLIDDSVFRRKLSWDEMRDYVSKFYSCTTCKSDYLKQVDLIVNRTNHVNGKKYKDETAIMSWELANEPRPMRPSAIEDYKKWVSEVAVFIRSKDKNHLITTGVEGEMGTENISVFEDIHKDKNVDYLTIHIWPKNWSWFQTPTMEKDLPQVISKTVEYIDKHIAVARKLNKPLVIEEFGLPRDHHSIDASSSTTLRNRYYDTIFSTWQQ